jgi:hypothetical protein
MNRLHYVVQNKANAQTAKFHKITNSSNSRNMNAPFKLN